MQNILKQAEDKAEHCQAIDLFHKVPSPAPLWLPSLLGLERAERIQYWSGPVPKKLLADKHRVEATGSESDGGKTAQRCVSKPRRMLAWVCNGSET